MSVTENLHMKHNFGMKNIVLKHLLNSVRLGIRGHGLQFPLCKVTSYVRRVGSLTSLGLTSLSVKGKAQLFIFHRRDTKSKDE